MIKLIENICCAIVVGIIIGRTLAFIMGVLSCMMQ